MGFGIRGPALVISGNFSARPAGLGVRNLGCRLWGLPHQGPPMTIMRGVPIISLPAAGLI